MSDCGLCKLYRKEIEALRAECEKLRKERDQLRKANIELVRQATSIAAASVGAAQLIEQIVRGTMNVVVGRTCGGEREGIQSGEIWPARPTEISTCLAARQEQKE